MAQSFNTSIYNNFNIAFFITFILFLNQKSSQRLKSLPSKIPYFSLYKFTFFVTLGIFTLTFILPQFVYHSIWMILLFFFFLTMSSLYVIKKLTKKKSQNFLAVYFSAMIGRLFISIIFAAIFILADRANVFNFSINFLILYLLFLGFEIYGIMTNLRHHS